MQFASATEAVAVKATKNGDPEPIEVSVDAGVRDMVEAFVAVGTSKFVLAPVTVPASWADELGALAETVLPLQTG